MGREELPYCCFAIVGGGMGERLNSSKPKLCLESNLITGQSFLGLYCSYFHAIEQEFNCVIPVAIMTSHATNDPYIRFNTLISRIQRELETNHYYGLDPSQVTLMLQVEVPSVLDASGTIALASDGHLLRKPHGHGDIHTLLYSYGLPQRWKQANKRHILFMQDTNVLAIYGFPSLLGVSVSSHLDFASLGIVRKPGEKVGSICRLQDASGRRLTCNVEYCDFERLLVALTGVGDEPNENGNSRFPGNINVLYANIASYLETLTDTHGDVPEFINPKYADETRTSFKTPARLECMMQDFPRHMPQKARIGYCCLPRWACFSPVKRDADSAIAEARKTGYGESFFSMEEDFYKLFRRALRNESMTLGDASWDEAVTPADGVPSLPIVLLTPFAALSLSEMRSHFTDSFQMSERSVLVLDGPHITIENSTLDGALEVHACRDAHVFIRDAHFQNDGWEMRRDPDGAFRRLPYLISFISRFSLIKKDTTVLTFPKPGTYYVYSCLL